MIVSGLGKVQGNLGVPRMLHYMMEHEYRWLCGDPLHRSFWDPPIFFPARNTAAYSETLLGAAPFYWFWRVLGVPGDMAYPLWILTMSTLNFFAAFLFLRQSMDRSDLAAGFGAFLFAFASMRLGYIGLTQLLPGFYLVLSIHALVGFFREEDSRRNVRSLALLAVSLLGQAYTCFYIAWFLGVGLVLALLWSLALPDLRAGALGSVRARWKGLAAALAVVAVGLVPFVVHSLQAAREVGYREYDEVETFLPRLQSWLYFGPDHWLYGGLSGARIFNSIPTRISEHAIGFGLVSWGMAALGLWNLRKSALGRILLAVGASLFLATVIFPGGATVWALVYLVVPGAKAIRAVARVSLLLLVPASAGAAAWVDAGRWKRPLLVAAVLFSMIEQGRTSPTFDRRESRDRAAALAGRVDPQAAAFWVSTTRLPAARTFVDGLPLRVHVDAMIASLEARVPTVNGYSGWNPPGWPLENLSIAPGLPGEGEVERLLAEWCLKSGLDRKRVQWVREDP